MFKKLPDVMSLLPDVIAKDGSRFGALVEVWLKQMNDIAETVRVMSEWKSIDKAEGSTLDEIGGNVGQPRGQATDEVYRMLLRSKLARMNANGSLDSVIQVLALALQAEPHEFRLSEQHSDPVQPEPAAVHVSSVPYEKLNSAGLSPVQFITLVERLVAAGVRVSQVELTGTFALASLADRLEVSEHGLADEAMTQGGSLGDLYVPGDDYKLPI
ncbi:DUF2612 domain-containing protein [Paenibacillus sp. SC116]|uniref:DUF2612 domain-containing protein n=1 Tax=Paenibacillus sp. SC116 TaxID=2968986 RepID=UPI00215B1A5C|nr:DUF2612 domain-containing protein [Paenibacillus sp. SC116]MCR8844203.1 DUF2612 domain-containing protein [Paenibacillus sp. SC116]